MTASKQQNTVPARLREVLDEARARQAAGRLDEAEALYRRGLALAPDNLDVLNQLGVLLRHRGEHENAIAVLSRALELAPSNPAVHNNLGNALKDAGHLDRAMARYERAIALDPRHAPSQLNRAQLLQRLGRDQDALDQLDAFIKLVPANAIAFNKRGEIHEKLGHLVEALSDYKNAAALDRGSAAALGNCGRLLLKFGNRAQALKAHEKAVAAEPRNAGAHYLHGAALAAVGKPAEAAEAFTRAIALDPGLVEAHFGLGVAFQDQKQFGKAITHYDAVLKLAPGNAPAWNNRGVSQQRLNRLAEAATCFGRAIELDPSYADAHYNMAVNLQSLGHQEAALESLEAAIASEPHHAEAHNNRGALLEETGALAEALASFLRARELKPHIKFLDGSIFLLRQRMCIWDDYQQATSGITEALLQKKAVSAAFPLLVYADSRALQNQASRFYRWNVPRLAGEPRRIPARSASRKIRIGYFSADFYNHATSHLLADLLETHDRERFEITAFSFGPQSSDISRQRIAAAVDSFVDIAQMNDGEAVKLADRMEIDIAIDLKGYTRGARPGIFFRRAAPVQVSFLGYPGTLASRHHDYLIADPVVIPPEHLPDYRERVIHLPGCYQPNDRKRPLPGNAATRAAHGLSEDAFVFCSFNNNYKITPPVFDLWAEILKAVPHSVLWLLEDNDYVAGNLRKEAAARGLDPARLVFGKRLPLAEHLDRHRLADLFLDTFPCNAHTTASDSLWAGLPLLTRIGESFVSRVAASLLTAAGLPELITASREAYRDKAVALAADRAKLAAMRQHIDQHRMSLPLFDTARYTRNIEQAYTIIHGRQMSGQAPEHIPADALA